MVKCPHCGGQGISEHIVSAYESNGLGTPFRVVLHHAVKAETCAKCGNVLGTYIPDLNGLLYAVTFSRALDSRKLVGEDVRFIRKAMGWKAKDLAKHLGISAEYLSRCENGQKMMSEGIEKLFRLYVLLKTPDTAALKELNLSELFELIKINVMWDVTNTLVFHFVRRRIEEPVPEGTEKWRKYLRPAKAA